MSRTATSFLDLVTHRHQLFRVPGSKQAAGLTGIWQLMTKSAPIHQANDGRGPNHTEANLRAAEWIRAIQAGDYEPRYELGGADLSGEDLRTANLSRANLAEADLRAVDLRGADLNGADLSGADLRGADLNGADLSGADLSGADLAEADLSGADLSGADLRTANLTGASLDRDFDRDSVYHDENTVWPFEQVPVI